MTVQSFASQFAEQYVTKYWMRPEWIVPKGVSVVSPEHIDAAFSQIQDYPENRRSKCHAFRWAKHTLVILKWILNFTVLYKDLNNEFNRMLKALYKDLNDEFSRMLKALTGLHHKHNTRNQRFASRHLSAFAL